MLAPSLALVASLYCSTRCILVSIHRDVKAIRSKSAQGFCEESWSLKCFLFERLRTEPVAIFQVWKARVDVSMLGPEY